NLDAFGALDVNPRPGDLDAIGPRAVDPRFFDLDLGSHDRPDPGARILDLPRFIAEAAGAGPQFLNLLDRFDARSRDDSLVNHLAGPMCDGIGHDFGLRLVAGRNHHLPLDSVVDR